MSLTIPISPRARRFGYIIWPKRMQEEVRGVLGDVERVAVVFHGRELGERRIDWKYSRISVGRSNTRDLVPGASSFGLRLVDDGKLLVETE